VANEQSPPEAEAPGGGVLKHSSLHITVVAIGWGGALPEPCGRDGVVNTSWKRSVSEKAGLPEIFGGFGAGTPAGCRVFVEIGA